MKNIKVAMVFLLVLLMITSCSQEKNYAPSIEEQIEVLKNKIELTNEQALEIKPILEERNDKIRELHEDSESDRSEIRQSIIEIRKEADEKIKEILTSEQVEKYNEFLLEQRNRRHRPN